MQENINLVRDTLLMFCCRRVINSAPYIARKINTNKKCNYSATYLLYKNENASPMTINVPHVGNP